MEKNLDSVFKNSKLWIVSQVNENVFEVLSHPSMSVDINAPTCLHFQWQLNGFPCSHTVIAFRNNGRNIYDYVDQFYHVKEFRVAYSGAIHLIPMVGKPKFNRADYLIAPPIVKRPPKRPTRKNIP
ncbi:hypothetical protein ACSBR2_035076 [Camellia fascicularis]